MTSTVFYGGLDLSLTSTGWAVLDQDGGLVRSGRIQADVLWPLPARYNLVRKQVVAAMNGVHYVARERPFTSRNPSVDRVLFGLGEIVLLALHIAQGRDEIPEVAPVTVKKLATGDGRGGKGAKARVQAAAVARWGPTVDQSDIADACWIAEWCRLEQQSGRWQ